MRKEGPKHTDLYWDCKCPEHYIHSILEQYCGHCDMVLSEGKQSIVSEVIDMFSHKRGSPNER